MIKKRYKIFLLSFFAINFFLLFANQSSFATDYEVLIIAPNKYVTQVQDLQALHNGNNTRTCYVSTEAIYSAYGITNHPAAEDPPFAGYKDGLDTSGKTNIKGYNYELAKRIIAFLRDVNSQTSYGLALLTPSPTNVEAKFTQLILFGNSQDIPPSYYAFFQEEYADGNVYDAWVPTDFFYSSPDYDWIPNLAVGRLPIKDVDAVKDITGTIATVHQFDKVFNGIIKTTSVTGDTYVYTGTCTSVTQTTFTVTGAGWIPGELSGAILMITSDPGLVGPDASGKSYTVLSNTADTLTFSGTSLVTDGVELNCGYGIADLRSQLLVNITSGDDVWTLNEYQNYYLTITTDAWLGTTVTYTIDYHQAKLALAQGMFILRDDQAWTDHVIPTLTFTVGGNLDEAVDTVNKISKWNTASAWNWFKNVAVAGGEPFGNSFYWSEFLIASCINQGNFEGNEVTKLYHTDGNFTRTAIAPSLTDTDFGLLLHSGHGSGNSIALDGTDITSDNVLTYFSTDDRLPILASEGCDNGAFDLELYSRTGIPISFGEASVLSFDSVNSHGGGAIAYFGASRTAYAGLDPYFVKGVLTQDKFYYMDGMLLYFTKYFHLNTSSAARQYYIGDIYLRSLKDSSGDNFIAQNDMSYWLNRKTVFEYILLGDPALPLPWPGITPTATTVPIVSVDESTLRTKTPMYESHDIPVDEIPTVAGTTNTIINITTDAPGVLVKRIDARRDTTVDPSHGTTVTPYEFSTLSASPSYYLVRVARNNADSLALDGKEAWIYVQVVNEFAKTPGSNILIVDDDYGYPFFTSTATKGYEDWYQKSLSDLAVTYPAKNYAYDLWHVDFDDVTDNIAGFNENDLGATVMHGEITEGLLGQYTTVIYETGGDYADNNRRGVRDTLTSPDQEYLQDYLTKSPVKGKLFLSGQDVMRDIGLGNFATNYLNLTAHLWAIGYGGLYTIEGFDGNPISSGLHNISLAGPPGAENQYTFNDVEPNALGSRAFEYLFTSGQSPPGVGTPPYIGTAATYSYVPSEIGPVVFFPFGFESIDIHSYRETVMGKVLDWLETPTATGGEGGAVTATPGDTLVTLTWSFPPSYPYILIIRKDSGGFPTGTPTNGTTYAAGTTIGDAIVVYAGSGSKYIDTGLTNGNTYYYSAFFYNSGHSYLARINVEATPNVGGGSLDAPTDLEIFQGHGSLTLQWWDHSDSEVGFSIERKTTGGSWAVIGTRGASGGRSSAQFIDETVTAGITYWYRVRAYNVSNYSDYSNSASGIPWNPFGTVESGGGGGGPVGPLVIGISALLGWWKRRKQKKPRKE